MRAAAWIGGPGALTASVLVHVAGLGAGAWLLARSLAREPAQARPAEIEVTLAGGAVELPSMNGAAVQGPRAREPELDAPPLAPGGGEAIARPDAPRAGRGGTDTASAPALNLADRDDGLTLERDPLSHLDRSQLGRLRTSRERASLDDRRATPHPMELTFVTTGAGERATRLVAARFDPSRGSLAGALPSTLGAHPGRAPEEAGSGPEPEAGGAPGSGERAVSAAGVIDGARGREHRRSATVTLARPWVPRARAAVPALRRASPADTVDSDEEVSSAVRSLLHASTAGGRAGSGPGGQTAPRAPGSGAVAGQGSRSTPVGTGPGALRDPSRDPRATGYFRAVERQLEPYWRDAFPEWAVSAGRGGVAVVGFTIAASGAVGGLRLVRTSGVAEFDRNVMTAIERAAPFGPLPALLGPGPLTLRVAFDATNPAVGRDGPGSGRGR